MSSQKIVPCWQINYTDLRKRCRYALGARPWVDCILIVSNGYYTRQFQVHKLFLALTSPVFEVMLYGSLQATGPILIVDLDPDAFHSFLLYCYTDELFVATLEHGQELYRVAHKYYVPDLMQKCIKELLDVFMDAGNVCSLLEMALLYNEKELQDHCYDLIQRDIVGVFQSSTFLESQPSTIVDIYSLEYFHIQSEIDLFYAAMAYVDALKNYPKAECSCSSSVESEVMQQNDDDKMTHQIENLEGNGLGEYGPAGSYGNVGPVESVSSDTDMDPETRLNDYLKTIRQAVQKIRFRNVSVKEFTRAAACKNSLLTESEIIAIIMNLSNENCEIPWPEGFSTSREPRCKGPMKRIPASHSWTTTTPIGLHVPVSYLEKTFRSRSVSSNRNRHVYWILETEPTVVEGIRYLGVYLVCDNMNTNEPLFVEADFKLIMNKPDGHERCFMPFFNKCLSKAYYSRSKHGIEQFIRWDYLMDPANGFITDGKIALNVSVMQVALRVLEACEGECCLDFKV